MENIYDYREFRQKIKIDIQKKDANLYSFQESLVFGSPRTTFTLIFPEYNITPPPSDLKVEWNIDGTFYERTLDLEDT